ncbi:MAG: PHP domain-containing protein, partial [Deferribacterales bacterium]
MIDLHCHSKFSDGTLSPQELINKAESIGLEILALTDHDTVDGVESFLNLNSAVKRIPGVEISIDYNEGTFHLVGLFIDHTNSTLSDTLTLLKDYRRERNNKIMKKLSELLQKDIKIEDISIDKYGELGRPHIARFLVKEGVASSIEDAFVKYLGKGKILYTDKKRLSLDESIQLIKKAGGITILAHPITLSENDRFNPTFFNKLKENGLDGIEVFCSLHDESISKKYLEIA